MIYAHDLVWFTWLQSDINNLPLNTLEHQQQSRTVSGSQVISFNLNACAVYLCLALPHFSPVPSTVSKTRLCKLIFIEVCADLRLVISTLGYF